MIKNIPYKKQVDGDGVEIVPPKGVYPQSNPNRQTRKRAMKAFKKAKKL